MRPGRSAPHVESSESSGVVMHSIVPMQKSRVVSSPANTAGANHSGNGSDLDEHEIAARVARDGQHPRATGFRDTPGRERTARAPPGRLRVGRGGGIDGLLYRGPVASPKIKTSPQRNGGSGMSPRNRLEFQAFRRLALHASAPTPAMAVNAEIERSAALS
jgi:hypothetical protein